MDPRLLMRMAQIARRRPSWRIFVLGLAALAAVLALGAVEAIWGWPEALTPARVRP